MTAAPGGDPDPGGLPCSCDSGEGMSPTPTPVPPKKLPHRRRPEKADFSSSAGFHRSLWPPSSALHRERSGLRNHVQNTTRWGVAGEGFWCRNLLSHWFTSGGKFPVWGPAAVALPWRRGTPAAPARPPQGRGPTSMVVPVSTSWVPSGTAPETKGTRRGPQQPQGAQGWLNAHAGPGCPSSWPWHRSRIRPLHPSSAVEGQ